MYRIKKTLEISAAHYLDLSYKSKCQNVHGHNWIVIIYCWCENSNLNKDGMVIDFTHIKKKIHNKLDHKTLNHIFSFNPTAENIAKWICDQFKNCYRVDVQESIGNTASYVDDNIDMHTLIGDIL